MNEKIGSLINLQVILYFKTESIFNGLKFLYLNKKITVFYMIFKQSKRLREVSNQGNIS